MSKKENLIDRKFGRLLVVGESAKKGKSGNCIWICLCECGNLKEVMAPFLKNGNIKSCGCLAIESRINHGMSRTITYSSWYSMKNRCTNPESDNYKNYGGRGISVCERWIDSLDLFVQDMGHRPSIKHTLDRIDNDGDYEPRNCRWAIGYTQRRNRRDNVWIEHNGKRMIFSDWAKEIGINKTRLKYHLKTKSIRSVIEYLNNKMKSSPSNT